MQLQSAAEKSKLFKFKIT